MGPIVDLTQDVARLRAELAEDADELGAMLVRVAASDRARDAAEKRALALEKWGQELEGKVAEARTRGDELEEELVRVKDALEVERVRRTFELESLTNKHRAELAIARGAQTGKTGMGGPAAREAMGKVIATLEELEKHESQSALARRRAFDQAREFAALCAAGASVAPPPPVTMDVPTVPPTKSSARRSRRPLPAPPSRPPSRPSRSSIPAPTPKSISAPHALSISTPLSVPTSLPELAGPDTRLGGPARFPSARHGPSSLGACVVEARAAHLRGPRAGRLTWKLDRRLTSHKARGARAP